MVYFTSKRKMDIYWVCIEVEKNFRVLQFLNLRKNGNCFG